jgi:hypothetical protein
VPNKQLLNKQTEETERRWLTPVILATQEAEIRRIVVQSQTGQIVPKDPISKKEKKIKKELVEWLKALSSNSSATKKKKHKRKETHSTPQNAIILKKNKCLPSAVNGVSP